MSGESPAVVLALGVPRSGTVLVASIARELLALRGPTPELRNPHGAELLDALQPTSRSGPPIIVHAHEWPTSTDRRVPAGSIVGWVNVRDPRDVCVSLMRLHDHDFATAAAMTVAAFDHAASAARRTELELVRYDDLMRDRARLIAGMADRLGITLDAHEARTVAERTSIDRHRAVMHEVRSGRRPRLRARQNRHRTLVEDVDTLINDRHIQSGRTGRWRTELDPTQAAHATDRFAEILDSYDFDTDESPA